MKPITISHRHIAESRHYIEPVKYRHANGATVTHFAKVIVTRTAVDLEIVIDLDQVVRDIAARVALVGASSGTALSGAARWRRTGSQPAGTIERKLSEPDPAEYARVAEEA